MRNCYRGGSATKNKKYFAKDVKAYTIKELLEQLNQDEEIKPGDVIVAYMETTPDHVRHPDTFKIWGIYMRTRKRVISMPVLCKDKVPFRCTMMTHLGDHGLPLRKIWE
jgi:chorismate mutase